MLCLYIWQNHIRFQHKITKQKLFLNVDLLLWHSNFLVFYIFGNFIKKFRLKIFMKKFILIILNLKFIEKSRIFFGLYLSVLRYCINFQTFTLRGTHQRRPWALKLIIWKILFSINILDLKVLVRAY